MQPGARHGTGQRTQLQPGLERPPRGPRRLVPGSPVLARAVLSPAVLAPAVLAPALLGPPIPGRSLNRAVIAWPGSVRVYCPDVPYRPAAGGP